MYEVWIRERALEWKTISKSGKGNKVSKKVARRGSQLLCATKDEGDAHVFEDEANLFKGFMLNDSDTFNAGVSDYSYAFSRILTPPPPPPFFSAIHICVLTWQ